MEKDFPQAPHEFVPYSRAGETCCTICRELIKEGLKCRACGYHIHKLCREHTQDYCTQERLGANLTKAIVYGISFYFLLISCEYVFLFGVSMCVAMQRSYPFNLLDGYRNSSSVRELIGSDARSSILQMQPPALITPDSERTEGRFVSAAPIMVRK